MHHTLSTNDRHYHIKSFTLTHLTHATLWNRYYINPHFTERDLGTKALIGLWSSRKHCETKGGAQGPAFTYFRLGS